MKKVKFEDLFAGLALVGILLLFFGFMLEGLAQALVIAAASVVVVGILAAIAWQHREYLSKKVPSIRGLSLLLICIVVLGNVAFYAYAAMTTDFSQFSHTQYITLSATNSQGTSNTSTQSVTASGNTITIKAVGYTVEGSCSDSHYSDTITVTATNGTGATIQFDLAFDSAVTSSTAAGTGLQLESGGKITFQVTSGEGSSASSTGTVTFSNVKALSTGAQVATNFTVREGGTLTVDGEALSASAELTNASDHVYALNASASSGYTFYGWMSAQGGLLATTADYSYEATEGSVDTVWPLFIKSDSAVFYIQDAQPAIYYGYLDEAITAAGTSGTIILYKSGSVYGTGGTVSFDLSGQTLLLPYAYNKNTIYTATATDDSGKLASTLENANVTFVSDRQDDGQGNDSIPGVLDPDYSVSYTLTVPTGTTINVNSGSKLVVGGTIVGGSYATQGICGATAGAHSNIQLEGTINVNSGGILSSTGYIRGNGTINVASGGIVYQPYVMMDHKDGHYVSGAKNEGCFPFYRHSMLNIQSKMVLNSGADLYGYVTFFTQAQSGILEAQYNVTCMHVVGSGSENALFLLGTGSKLEMTHEASKTLTVTSSATNNNRGFYAKVGRTTMSFTGDVALGYMALSINVLGSNYSMSTETSVFPIPYNYNIIQNSGTFSANYEMALLPGATFTVANGAALTVASGVNFAVYDGFRDYSIRSESLTLDGEDGTGGTWAQFHYPTSANLRSAGFSSTAELIVNGTLNVNGNLGGTVQTGGTTGTIVMGASAGNSVTSVLGVVNKSNTITIPIINKSFSFLGSCGKTTRTLTAQVFPTNKTTPLTLEAGKTYTTTGAGTNTLSSYTYGVYTTHNATAATSETKNDLNATINGTWCISGHDWADATCTAPQTCSICGATQGDPLDHSYGDPTFTWADDYSCTAVVTCSSCGGTKDLTVSVESEVTTEATCSAEGERTYTATATDDQGNTYTDTETQVIDKQAHTYNEDAVSFAWSENTCTATYKCTVCGAEGTGACTVTSETEAATCQKAGQTVYTASITLSGKDYTDTKPVTLDQLAHNYSDPTFAWAEDYSTCTATYTCSVGGESHTVDCEVKSTTVAATCTAAGKTTHTASIEVDGTTYTDTEEIVIAQLGHSYGEGVVTTEPTCTAAGVKTFTCAACGGTKTEAIAALGHTEEVIAAVAPTCTATGLTEGKKCSVCNDILVAQTVVDALGHSYGEGVVTTEPTCTVAGVKTFTCGTCGDTNTEAVAALGHTEEIVAGTAATCTATGLTDGKKCTVCGTVTVAQEVIDKLSHTEEAVAGKAATCTEDGLTDGTKCSVCGETVKAQETIPATGHTEETVPGTPATCTEDGLTDGKKCTVCGAVTLAQTEIPASGHQWENGVCTVCQDECEHEYKDGTCTVCSYGCEHSYASVVTDPTCTEQGYTTYTCPTCENSYIGDYVPALGHDMADATCTEASTCSREGCSHTDGDPLGHNYEAVVTAPTCTAQGYTTHTCSRCSDSYVDTYVDAAGHNEGAPVVENEVAATCTDEGSYDNVVYCTVCNAELSRDTVTVPATGHTDGEAVTENNVDATCTDDGSYDTVTYCTVCGEETSRVTTTVPATGHTAGAAVTENEVAATCTTAGSYDTVVYCSACDVELSRETIPVAALGHTDGEPVVENNVAPTCAAGGSYESVVYCTVCSAEVSRETVNVAALGHKYESAVTAPTCTAEGYTTHTCTVCGDTYTGDTTAALGHTDGEAVVENEVAATCTTDGSYDTVTYCTVCGVETSRETTTVPAAGHTAEAVAGKDATCTEAGLTEGSKCSVCGETLTAQEEIPALGHSYDDGVVTTAPTCTAEGEKTFTCTACGDTYAESIAATGHSHEAVVTAPTCTEGGYTTYTCTICGDSYKDNYVDAQGHSYTSKVTTAATCTVAGVKTYTCSACGDSYTEEIAAKGHAHEAVVTAPTCTEAGYTTYTCSACGDTYTADQVDALGHSYESVVTAPTCTTAGYTTHTCSVCGHSYTDSETAATGEHSYVDGKCSVCGAEEVLPDFGFMAQVNMGNNLDMMFAFKRSALEDWTGHYLKMVRTYADRDDEDIIIIPYEEWIVDGNFFVITYGGFAAKEMCDEITLTVYNAQNNAVCKSWVDSMRSYAQRRFANATTDVLRTMIVDMVNYGAAAQENFDYNTDDLANNWLTAEQKAYASELQPVFDPFTRDQTKWFGSNLITKSNIQYMFAFKGITDDMYAVVQFTGHKGNEEEITIQGKDFAIDGSFRILTLENLVVADARCTITVTVYNADGSIYTQGQDSMEAYVKRKGGTGLAGAFMKFADSAYTYLHS